MKIDIGAVILGVILGAGAFLVIPKLVGTLNGGYGYGEPSNIHFYCIETKAK